MASRIKVTSRRLPKIISTSPKLRPIDGSEVAEALGAERIEVPAPRTEIPSERPILDELTTVNGQR